MLLTHHGSSTDMTSRPTANRRRAPRFGSVRLAQGGAAARGVVVATGIVAALVLQLAGPRLQCRLADLVGMPSPMAAPAPAAIPSCGTPASDANPMRPCKVAEVASAAPVALPGI